MKNAECVEVKLQLTVARGAGNLFRLIDEWSGLSVQKELSEDKQIDLDKVLNQQSSGLITGWELSNKLVDLFAS